MKKLTLLYTTLLAIASCFGSCNDSDNTPNLSASIFKLSKVAYTATDGSKVTSPWTSNEKCGLFVSGCADRLEANTINTTEAALPFTFPVPTDNAEKQYCFFYPYAETASFSDGKLSFDLTAQSGELTQYCAALYKGSYVNNTTSAPKATLNPVLAIARIHIPASSASDPHKLAKVSFCGNNGELIGGTATVDMETMAVTGTDTKCEVSYDSPVSLSDGMNVYVAMVPASLEKGYTVTVTDETGKSNSLSFPNAVTFAQGTINPVSGKFGYTELAFVGSTNVYIINADNSTDDQLDVLWHWDSSKSDIPASHIGMFVHCDDAKSVDNGSKILVTSSSSTGGCALIERDTQKCLFYARGNNAHSAEWLPNGRIVVACSTGANERCNSLLVFNTNEPDVVKFQTALTSAHGVQWIESRQRLYAIGEDNLIEYSLQDWNTDAPQLKTERVITTPKSGLHDLTIISNDELLCAGNNAYILHLDDLTFTEVTQFHGETDVKSVNYNKDSGVIWTTIAEDSWWTFHIKEMHIGSNDAVKVLSVPFDKFGTNVYKCRIYQW